MRVEEWHRPNGVRCAVVWKDADHESRPIAWVHPYLYLGDPSADARLIAALPDLLAAARLTALHFKRCHASGWDMGDDEHEAWSALNAAIAKAEGTDGD